MGAFIVSQMRHLLRAMPEGQSNTESAKQVKCVQTRLLTASSHSNEGKRHNLKRSRFFISQHYTMFYSQSATPHAEHRSLL